MGRHALGTECLTSTPRSWVSSPAAQGAGSLRKPTCHFDVPCGFGNAVLDHAGVCVVDCDIVEHRYNLHGHILRVQLKAGVGDF